MNVVSYFRHLLHLTPRYDSALTIRNVVYCNTSDVHVNHKMDIFLPKLSNPTSSSASTTSSTEKQIPIVVHVHGGGWVRGSRIDEGRGGPTVGRTCARHGYIGVVVSYRLARISLLSYFAWSLIFASVIIIIGIALFSWQLILGYFIFMMGIYLYHYLFQVHSPIHIEHMLDDICQALIYIRDHIDEHCSQADISQIFLSGHSAGAHLISLLVLDPSHFVRHQFSLQNIRGVIPMSGIYSLNNPTHLSPNHIRNWIFRILYSSNLRFPLNKTRDDFSPIEYIRSINEGQNLPPFLVMSARFDMGLEVDAKRFVERLQQCGHHVEYQIIGRWTTHASIANHFSQNDAHRYFLQFIEEQKKY